MRKTISRINTWIHVINRDGLGLKVRLAPYLTSWKTKLGFYTIITSEIFKLYGYNVSDSFLTIGFALMLLGIAHKAEGK